MGKFLRDHLHAGRIHLQWANGFGTRAYTLIQGDTLDMEWKAINAVRTFGPRFITIYYNGNSLIC